MRTVQTLRVLMGAIFLLLLVMNLIAGQWANAAISALILGLVVAAVVLGYKQSKLAEKETKDPG